MNISSKSIFENYLTINMKGLKKTPTVMYCAAVISFIRKNTTAFITPYSMIFGTFYKLKLQEVTIISSSSPLIYIG